MAASQNYVAGKNVSKLMQWMTAELIRSEPEQPISFLKKLLEEHEDKKYDDNMLSSLLADSIKSISSSKSKMDGLKSNVEVGNLENLMNSFSLISKLDASNPKRIETILMELTKLTNAETCLFHDDIDYDSKIIMFHNNKNKKAIPFGEGLLGRVMNSREAEIVTEDKATSRIMDCDVHSAIACPIVDSVNNVIGIIQILNKDEGKFTRQDLLLTSIMANVIAVSLRAKPAQNHTHVMAALVDLIETVKNAANSDIPISSLIFTITRRTHEIVASDRCTLFVVDRNCEQMWSMQGEINIRIPINKGIAGSCATYGNIINIQDAYQDSRFNPSFDKKSGYHTKTILCIPMKLPDGQVIGVLQLINKFDGVFTGLDAKLLSLILESAAPAFAKIEHFKKAEHGPEMPQDLVSTSAKSSFEKGMGLEPLLETVEEDDDLSWGVEED